MSHPTAPLGAPLDALPLHRVLEIWEEMLHDSQTRCDQHCQISHEAVRDLLDRVERMKGSYDDLARKILTEDNAIEVLADLATGYEGLKVDLVTTQVDLKNMRAQCRHQGEIIAENERREVCLIQERNTLRAENERLREKPDYSYEGQELANRYRAALENVRDAVGEMPLARAIARKALEGEDGN